MNYCIFAYPMRAVSKYILTFLLIVFSCVITNAQTKKIDSLLASAKISLTDTGTASILNGITSLLIYVDINRAALYSDSALNLSTKAHFARGIAEALNSKGVILTSQGRYSEALKDLNASGKIYTALSNKTGVARTLSNIGIVYDLQGENGPAMNYYQQALELNLQLNNQRGIGYSYNNIGIIYNNQGNFSRALDYYFKGLSAREKAGDATGICGSYTNIGLAYSSLQDYNKALIYYQKATDLTEKYKDKLTAASLYSDIGFCYSQKKKYDLAQDFYKKALQLSLENNDNYSVLLVLNSIGENFQARHEIDSAQAYYQKCLDLSVTLNSRTDLGVAFYNLGALAFEKKKYNIALSLIEEAEKIAVEINNFSLLESVYNYKSNCYEKMNDESRALLYYKKHINIRDSIFNEDNTKKNVQVEMNYQFDKKEAAGRLEQEKKEAVALADRTKQNVILWSVSGLLLIVLAFALFAYRSYLQKQRANIEITKQKHLIEEKQKEILDSIYYARRIQRALLPSEIYIGKNLKN